MIKLDPSLLAHYWWIVVSAWLRHLYYGTGKKTRVRYLKALNSKLMHMSETNSLC